MSISTCVMYKCVRDIGKNKQHTLLQVQKYDNFISKNLKSLKIVNIKKAHTLKSL